MKKIIYTGVLMAGLMAIQSTISYAAAPLYFKTKEISQLKQELILPQVSILCGENPLTAEYINLLNGVSVEEAAAKRQAAIESAAAEAAAQRTILPSGYAAPYTAEEINQLNGVIEEMETELQSLESPTEEIAAQSETYEEAVPYGTPYMERAEDGVTDYHETPDGILSVVAESEKTEENIILLAKLIHCEAGGQVMEGKLAVATVVVNRAFDGNMGNTIKSVIERPNQFTPVSKSSFQNTKYTESDYEAARKVLLDGYRSFPAYVMYFQSRRKGYFGGQSTYSTCYNANKTSPQYFSYKPSDAVKYAN